MISSNEAIRQQLFALADAGYKEFHSALMPTVNKDKIIGVRTPLIRQMAKDLQTEKEGVPEFMRDLPHKYYEEDNLHAVLICGVKDFDTCLELTEQFLPYIDNWATCDMLRPKAFNQNKPKLYKRILVWLKSKKPYVVRFAIGMLLSYFLDDAFCKEHLTLVAETKNGEYYVDMMVAWYFATALAKQRNSAIKAMEQKLLTPWRHNKAIAKACESYRISDEDKIYLRTLKIKEKT